jgi:hypothetical protein
MFPSSNSNHNHKGLNRMTTYATAISTPAAGIVTALATAITDVQALATALAPGVGGAPSAAGAFLAGCTLSGLATSTTSWKIDAGEMRGAVAQLQQSLSVANQQAVVISNLLANIGTLD